MENPIMIRGHTDSLGYGDPRNMNNWMLSSGRAEATRRRLSGGGVPEMRFERIEGVADREPLIVDTPTDPRNRRVSITLLFRRIMDQDKNERFGRGPRPQAIAAR